MVLRAIAWWALGVAASYALAMVGPILFQPPMFERAANDDCTQRWSSPLMDTYQTLAYDLGDDADPLPTPEAWRARLLKLDYSSAGLPLIEPRRTFHTQTHFWLRQAGFPLRCTWGWSQSHRRYAQSASNSGGGLLYVAIPWSDSNAVRASCWHPLWPALLADGAILGTGAFLLLHALGFARQIIRRQRGLCPYCGYDRSGLTSAATCPECGEPARAGIIGCSTTS